MAAGAAMITVDQGFLIGSSGVQHEWYQRERNSTPGIQD